MNTYPIPETDLRGVVLTDLVSIFNKGRQTGTPATRMLFDALDIADHDNPSSDMMFYIAPECVSLIDGHRVVTNMLLSLEFSRKLVKLHGISDRQMDELEMLFRPPA